MFDPKPIHKNAVAAALERAMRYRLLNEPFAAESICRDILAVDPKNHEAQTTLLLALTDQFEFRTKALDEAHQVLDKFKDEYSRVYYDGLIFERRAKARYHKGGMGVGNIVYEWLRYAMKCYEKAEKLSPAGNDEAILRWNTCARFINTHPDIKPEADEKTNEMLE